MTAVAKRDPESRPPPRKPSSSTSTASSSSSSSSVAPPASSAAPGADEFDGPNTNSSDDATQGEWLFKQDDLVLGPVSAIVLVERIKKGDLGADTPVARDGQPFRPMKLVRLFRDAWAATEEERRLAAEEKAYQSAVTRARLLRVLVVLGLFAVPFFAAAAGARALMIARPWDDSAAWIAKVPPLVDLPPKPVEAKKDPPPATVAQADPPADDTDDDDDGADAKDPTKPKKPKKPRDKKNDGKADPNSDPKADPKGDDAKVDDKKDDVRSAGKLPETLTNAEAIAPLKGAQGAMKACFKAEMESNPDMPAQVVLSYTVTEDGKATNIALDARELRGRPVVACVQKAIGALSWPKFSGERKNVSVPFKLGKPPAPKP